jgi:hypothetical protein
MSPIKYLIERCFHRREHRHEASNFSVAVDAGLYSRNLSMGSNCTHQEAIAEIEKFLEGNDSSAGLAAEEPFQSGRHGII